LKEPEGEQSPVDNENYLQGWTETIKKIGERRQAEDDFTLKKFKRDLNKSIREIRKIPNDHLVHLLRGFAGRSSHDPRLTAEYVRWADHLEAELKRRLNQAVR